MKGTVDHKLTSWVRWTWLQGKLHTSTVNTCYLRKKRKVAMFTTTLFS